MSVTHSAPAHELSSGYARPVAAIVYANGTYQAGLNLEWSPLQVTWQSVLK